MEALKNIKKNCFSKEFIFNQIILFSIVGILFLLFCKIAANCGFGYLLSDFYLVPSKSKIEEYLCLTAYIIGIIYLIGYSFKSYNAFFTKELPQINLKPFAIFLNSLPLLLTYSLYLILFFIIGALLTSTKTIFTILVCFLPFIWISLIKYSKELKLKKTYFKPSYLLKIIYRYFFAGIYYTLKFFCLEFVVFFILIKFYFLVIHKHGTSTEFAIQLIYGCFICYLLFIFQILYAYGLKTLLKTKND